MEDGTLERLLTEARRAAGAEAGTVFVRDGDLLRFAAVQNDRLAERLGAAETRRRVGERPLTLGRRGIATFVALTARPVNVADAYADEPGRPFAHDRDLDARLAYRTQSVLALPLGDGGGGVFGVLELINAVDGSSRVAPFDGERVRPVARLVTGWIATGGYGDFAQRKPR